MKQLLLVLLLVSFSASSALADSPEAILKDYRKAAAQAVERLNQSLEKTATPMITKLVKDGDTAGAELLTAQIKEKQAGDAVPNPQASVVQLFALYDDARAKALAPVQKSSIARIDSLLKTAGGAKLETVTELGKVRKEIEAGKAPSANDLPVEWSYRSSPTGPHLSKVFFERDGSARMEAGPDSQTGTWEWKRKGVFIAKLSNDTWTITMKKGYAELESERLKGLRYLVPFEQK
ncbi:MAG: hypothetical protein NTY98_02890 [Verrucomicrobia bacterium]|nr:hypothetical protein [Verrucomicrobiota bacterium]